MSMDYIRKTYGVPAKRGGRVRFESAMMGFNGTIIGSRGPHLRVRSDINGAVYLLHPTWRIEYLSGTTK